MSARGYIGAAVLAGCLVAGFVIGAVLHTIERALSEDGDPWNG